MPIGRNATFKMGQKNLFASPTFIRLLKGLMYYPILTKTMKCISDAVVWYFYVLISIFFVED